MYLALTIRNDDVVFTQLIASRLHLDKNLRISDETI